MQTGKTAFTQSQCILCAGPTILPTHWMLCSTPKFLPCGSKAPGALPSLLLVAVCTLCTWSQLRTIHNKPRTRRIHWFMFVGSELIFSDPPDCLLPPTTLMDSFPILYNDPGADLWVLPWLAGSHQQSASGFRSSLIATTNSTSGLSRLAPMGIFEREKTK